MQTRDDPGRENGLRTIQNFSLSRIRALIHLNSMVVSSYRVPLNITIAHDSCADELKGAPHLDFTYVSITLSRSIVSNGLRIFLI